jgi:hypothetical protein
MHFPLKHSVLSLAALCAVALEPASVLAVEYYEPFKDSDGTSPPSGWKQLHEELAHPDPGTVISGSLDFPGFAKSEGNSFRINYDRTEVTRASWQSPEIANLKEGTVYYSFLLRVENLGRLIEEGGHTALIMLAEQDAGFAIGGRAIAGVAIRKQGTGYRLGISSEHRGFQEGAAEAPQDLLPGDTVFAVVRFDYGSNTADLWINPTPGQSEPQPAASADPTRVRLKEVNCVVIGGQTSVTVVPEDFVIDEIRVGRSWEEVTPGS